ncbi:MAG: DUF1232 domain-containing protein [Deltaproteobacteria bacterium]|nr:DUF1232 domain-containing protein [Deltaproteobacteria bacterium]
MTTAAALPVVSLSTSPKRRGMLAMLSSPTSLWRFFRDREAPRGAKVTALLALAYVLFPLDVIPDLAPVVGWLDDLGMTAVAVGFLAQQAARHEALKEAQRGR